MFQFVWKDRVPACWSRAIGVVTISLVALAGSVVLPAPAEAQQAAPQDIPFEARMKPEAGPSRRANLDDRPPALAADLDASADYYRGYRDALRDTARMNQWRPPSRSRADWQTARTWPNPSDRYARPSRPVETTSTQGAAVRARGTVASGSGAPDPAQAPPSAQRADTSAAPDGVGPPQAR